MKQRITELSLTTTEGISPFAVVVEGGDSFAWAMPDWLGPTSDTTWPEYVLARKERNPQECWTLEAWREWLSDLGELSVEKRRKALQRLESSSPGIVVRKPKNLSTRLPVGAIATRWCRDRLFNRAEIITAQIAANLSTPGTAHWNAALQIGDRYEFPGDWIVEHQTRPERETNLAVLSVLDNEDAEVLKALRQEETFSFEGQPPRWVLVIQNSRKAEITEWGCIVGDRFAAPVSLAVAAIKASWHSRRASRVSGNDQEPSQT